MQKIKKYIIKNKILIIIISIALLAVFLRFWRLGIPSEPVFDEVYYPKWAAEFLQGQTPYDVHPPLVKLLIATSEILFGNNPWAWRFVSALLGTLLIPITYVFAKKLFKNINIGIFASILISFEGLFFVQSRIGIMESIVVFFLVFSLFCFWQFMERDEKRPIFWLILTGISIGLAISSKWTNLSVWGLIIFWLIYQRKNLPNINRFLITSSLIILPIIIYIVLFIIWYHGWNNFNADFVKWHISAYNFHHTLTAAHPYASRWWSWPFLLRPVWYYYKSSDGLVNGIIALGNPLIYWSAFISFIWVCLSLISDKLYKNKGILFSVLAFLFTFLPWIFIKRIEFNYYYIASLYFGIVLLSYVLSLMWNKYRALVLSYLLLVILFFLFFYPILADWPIKPWYYNLHVWFKSWI